MWNAKRYRETAKAQETRAKAILENYTFNKDDNVLDVGCGDGRVTAYIASQTPEGSVLGIDKSKHMIALAKEYEKEFSHLTVKQEDACDINYHEKFDIVTSFLCLLWIKDQQKALNNIARALKKNGTLILTTSFNKNHPGNTAFDNLIATEKWAPYFKNYVKPWIEADLESTKKLVQNAGLNIISADVITQGGNNFDSLEKFCEYIQAFPLAQDFPEKHRKAFIYDMARDYALATNQDLNGPIAYKIDLILIIAQK